MGCDTAMSVSLARVAVSIHAPVWGATESTRFRSLSKWFQSTHPYGVRLLEEYSIIPESLFQSTHPYGVRRAGGAES